MLELSEGEKWGLKVSIINKTFMQLKDCSQQLKLIKDSLCSNRRYFVIAIKEGKTDSCLVKSIKLILAVKTLHSTAEL